MTSHPFSELTLPAVRGAANIMGATVFELREHVLMVRRAQGFLIYFDPYGRVLMPYCCVVEGLNLNPENAAGLRYLQDGDPMTKNAWAWLPRIAEGGTTSYHVKKQSEDGSFEWFIQKVRPLQDIPLTASSNDALVAGLARQIVADLSDQVTRLSTAAGAS